MLVVMFNPVTLYDYIVALVAEYGNWDVCGWFKSVLSRRYIGKENNDYFERNYSLSHRALPSVARETLF